MEGGERDGWEDRAPQFSHGSRLTRPPSSAQVCLDHAWRMNPPGAMEIKAWVAGIAVFHNTALIDGATPRLAQGWHGKTRGHDDEGIDLQATRPMVLFSQLFIV